MTYLSAREIVHKLPSLLDGSVDVLVKEDEEERGQDVDHHHHLDHVDDGVGGGNPDQFLISVNRVDTV